MFDIEKSKAICEAATEEFARNLYSAHCGLSEDDFYALISVHIEAKDREIERLRDIEAKAQVLIGLQWQVCIDYGNRPDYERARDDLDAALGGKE